MSNSLSQAWYNLAINIHQTINQHLLGNFIDLSETEKCRVLERVSRNLKATAIQERKLNSNSSLSTYGDLNERICDILKQNDASQSFFTDNPSFIKTDDILNKICDDIVDLLYKWPDRKYKLHAFFNQSLPQPIRFVSWYLYLSNDNYRQKFLDDLANHPQSVLSPMDTEIQGHCDRFIGTLPLASDIKNSKENMNAIKLILSYYRSLFANKRDLVDAEYYYVIPIVLSHSTSLSRFEVAYEKSLSILIEMYRTFLEKMPPILRNNYLNNSIQNFDPWFRKIEYYLQKIDQTVYNHILTTLRSSYPHISKTDDSHVLILLRKCCYTWFKYMFVNCFTTDPLLFVWEQYLITSDIPNFHDEFLPAIATGIIVTLRDLLLECKKASEIESVLQNKTNTIVTHQLQSIIARFFLPKPVKSNIVPIVQHNEGSHQSEQQLNVKTNPVHDLLRIIAQTCNRVVHGDEENKLRLNAQTKDYICLLKFDLKMAEREVIGRILSIDERNSLPYQQKQIYNQQNLQAVNKRIQNRYAAERKRLLDKN